MIPRSPRELKRTLGSTTLKDRAAQLRLADAEAEYERLVTAARLRANVTAQTLTEAGINFLAQTYAHRLTENLRATHYDPSDELRDWIAASAWRFAPFGFMDSQTAKAAGRGRAWTNSERLREELPELLTGWRMLRADGNAEGIIQAEGQTAENLLNEHNLTTDLTGKLFFDLCLSLLRVDIAAGEQLELVVTIGTEIEPVEPPVALRESDVGQGEQADQRLETETLDDLGDALIASIRNPIGRSTAQSWRTALRYWREAHGAVGWGDITRRQVAEWLDLLAKVPARLKRKDAGIPLRELVSRYENDESVQRLSGKTQRQHLGSLSAIWGKAKANGIIDREDSPFQGHSVEVENKLGGNPLTRRELEAMLALPIYSDGERPSRGRGEASYWIPLLSLCTGARPGEIAQLMVNDFWQDDAGRLLMKITDEGVHPKGGPRRLKTSRKNSGRRTFPVPQPLLDLGLIRYLEWLKQGGDEALFPKLTLTSKGLYDGWARWWGVYVRKHGVIPVGKRQLRELRHNFPTAALASGVSYAAVEYLMGHKPKGTTSRYGDHSPLGREIEKIADFGVALNRVPVWQPPKSRFK